MGAFDEDRTHDIQASKDHDSDTLQDAPLLNMNRYVYIEILTTPFCTLNPSWYFTSGRLINTSTTGGHGTTVSFTTV